MIDRILKNPKRARIPKDTLKLYDLCVEVGNALTPDNINALMPFIYRLPFDYQAFIFKISAVGLHSLAIMSSAEFMRWTTAHHKMLL